MATPQEVRLDIDRLTGMIAPMGWEIIAQDLRGDDVLLTLRKAKSAVPSVETGQQGTVSPAGAEGGGG